MFRKPGCPKFELLVTDMVLPGMSGKRVAGMVQALLAEVAIVFMSGYTEDTIVNQGVLNSGLHFLSKPFSGEALLEKAEFALRSERRRLCASVLVVASDEGLTDELRTILQQAEHQVCIAATTAEGLQSVKQIEFDIILADLDVKEPKQANLDIAVFLQEVRRVRRSVPLGVIVGSEDLPVIEWNGQFHPDFTIPKPLDAVEVISILHGVLAAERY